VPGISAFVLHVPYTFFPDSSGGTEVYVAELIAALRERAFRGSVAAPAREQAEYAYEGIPVYRFAQDLRQKPAYAYGEPDEAAAASFRGLVQRLRPDIVHMHAQTAAVSEGLADIAHDGGAQVVFTYHTPTVSCLRGSMMYLGAEPCDGVLDVTRCAVCVLQKHGVSERLSNLLGRMPSGIGKALGDSGVSGQVVTALRMRENTAGAHRRFTSLMAKADRVIAVCEWVKDVLLANNVREDKIRLCRQGFSGPSFREGGIRQRGEDGSLRLAYFGRIDPVKGLDVVIDALKLIPDARVTLDVYGIVQPGSETYASALKASGDVRVQFMPAVPRGSVGEVMARYDFVVVPSRWLETGPLVVYEAFASGTPILGSHLGGIAELVSNGRDGILVPSNNPRDWAAAIEDLARDNGRVDRLRAGIRPPRTMADVADEMARHYSDLRASLTAGA